MDIVKAIIERAAERIDPKLARLFVDTAKRLGFATDGHILYAWKLGDGTLKTEHPINLDTDLLAKTSRPLVAEDKRILRVPLDAKLLAIAAGGMDTSGYMLLDVYPADGGYLISLAQGDRQALVMSLLSKEIPHIDAWEPFTKPAEPAPEGDKPAEGETTQES